MATDHLVQHLQQDVPDVLQRLEPVIDHVYRNYLHDALDATRKHWYVALTTQYGPTGGTLRYNAIAHISFANR